MALHRVIGRIRGDTGMLQQIINNTQQAWLGSAPASDLEPPRRDYWEEDGVGHLILDYPLDDESVAIAAYDYIAAPGVWHEAWIVPWPNEEEPGDSPSMIQLHTCTHRHEERTRCVADKIKHMPPRQGDTE